MCRGLSHLILLYQHDYRIKGGNVVGFKESEKDVCVPLEEVQSLAEELGMKIHIRYSEYEQSLTNGVTDVRRI